jgi:hypothetical protein
MQVQWGSTSASDGSCQLSIAALPPPPCCQAWHNNVLSSILNCILCNIPCVHVCRRYPTSILATRPTRGQLPPVALQQKLALGQQMSAVALPPPQQVRQHKVHTQLSSKDHFANIYVRQAAELVYVMSGRKILCLAGCLLLHCSLLHQVSSETGVAHSCCAPHFT